MQDCRFRDDFVDLVQIIGGYSDHWRYALDEADDSYLDHLPYERYCEAPLGRLGCGP